MMSRFKWLPILVAVCTFGTLHAQDRHVSFPAARTEVGRAMKCIEQQTDMTFSYSSRLLDTSAQVRFSDTSLTLDEALKQLFAGQGLTHMYHNRYIIVHRKAASPKPAREFSDTYTPTPSGSLDPAPLRRPETVDTAAAPEPIVRRVRVERPAADRSTFRSDYMALENHYGAERWLPSMALKTNLLYGAATLTPNLAFEIGLGHRTTLGLSGGYNPWNRVGTQTGNRKLVHFVVRPELRHWFCERFDGHFIGVNPFYDRFNISDHTIPFVGFKKGSRYEGHAVGGGVNYGYHLALDKRWGVEFSAGAGAAWMKYDRFDCVLCSEKQETKERVYIGPTHFSVSMVFLIK